jgi:nucleotide-binding universal stress UspA family protein
LAYNIYGNDSKNKREIFFVKHQLDTLKIVNNGMAMNFSLKGKCTMAEKSLLVLIDGSERSLKTVESIGHVKPFLNFKIVLFHVFTGMPEGMLDSEKNPVAIGAITQLSTWEEQKKRSIRSFMDQARNCLTAAGCPNDAIIIKIHNREKGIARDILTEASKGYFAVVMDRRGMGAWAEIAVGSIARKLISKLSFVPIMIAGQSPSQKKILVGIDGSNHSIHAAEFAAEIFGGSGYSVELFHVIRGFGGMVPEGPEFMMPAEYLEGLTFEMKKLFMSLRDKFIKAGFDEEKISEKIMTGACSRAQAIVEEAQTQGCGIIVVGRKGLSSVQEFFMGRVSDKIVQTGKQLTLWIV